MPDESNNCPTCNDHPMGEALPGSTPSVLVQPYTPPTPAELEFTRNFYAAMEARNGNAPDEGVLVQTQGTSPALGNIALQDGMKLPDISGMMMEPYGPVARSLQAAADTSIFEPTSSALAATAKQIGFAPNVASNRLSYDSSDTDALIPSQLDAPWLELASETAFPLGASAFASIGRLTSILEELDQRAQKFELDCLAKKGACESAAAAALLAGTISRAEYNVRIAVCNHRYLVCTAWAGLLRGVASALRLSPSLRGQFEKAHVAFQSCLTQAMQISDPARRAQALKACHDSYRSALETIVDYANIQPSAAWNWIMERFQPTSRLDCPCCVGSKSDLQVHATGDVQGVADHHDYTTADIGTNWPAEAYKVNGPVQSRLGWGYSVEFSVPYNIECPCTCEWTQLVTWGDEWHEDRAHAPTHPDENVRENNRQHWKHKCANGRLYIGDIVQQFEEGTWRFRTIFFSSGTNCPRRWVSVDWKLTAKRIPNPPDPNNPWSIVFEELGRAEG